MAFVLLLRVFEVTQVFDAVAVASWNAIPVVQLVASLLASMLKTPLPEVMPLAMNCTENCVLCETSNPTLVVEAVTAFKGALDPAKFSEYPI